MTDFRSLTIENGLGLDLSDDAYPAQIRGWNGETVSLSGEATHYGLVTRGEAALTDPSGEWRLRAGMFFVLPGAGRVGGPDSAGLVISRLGYTGLWQIGGPPETRGRLR